MLNAATSLGLAAEDPDAVRNLLQDKLVSALRQVAAEMEIQDLLVNRASFIQRVSGHVETDIAHNGLKLESVTISQLDQTPRTALRAEDNIFDAQGARLITETVTQMRVESNEITLGAERKIKQEQVATNKFLYEQEVQAAAAAAERDRQITTVQAEKEQQAATATAEQTRLAGLAGIERERALQVAAVQRDQSVEVANQTRERAATLARLERQQAEELAQRDMTIQIAERERMRAAAQAQQLAAEAERAQQAQAVRTVEVTAEAERRKNEQVINAQAGAEQARVEQETAARVEAYRLTTLAEARQQAAQREAEARLVAAKAERDAQLLEVEAKRAEETIPVDVERERVAVEQARVEVLSRELATKAQHESISRDLQIALARIEAEQAVAVARAQAMAQAFANAQMQIWGDPTTLSRMTQAFLDGQGTSMKIDGFVAGVSPEVKGVAANVGTLLARYAKEQFGLDVKPEEAEQLLKQLTADQAVADPGTNGTDR